MVLPYLHGEYVEVLSALCSSFPYLPDGRKITLVFMGDVYFLCHPAFSIETRSML